MFSLDCNSCGETFIRMAELRKHTVIQHYARRNKAVKRKSIFAGIELDKRNSKEARRSFLLVFTCNFCPDKFTRLGEFKKHLVLHEGEEKEQQSDADSDSDDTEEEEEEEFVERRP